MNNFDGLEEAVLLSPRPRKRGRCKEYHDCEKCRKIRHLGGGKVPQIDCAHNARANPKLCHADVITPADLALNHVKFYQTPNKVDQDAFILNLMEVSNPSRRRVHGENVQKNKNVTVKYSLLS